VRIRDRYLAARNSDDLAFNGMHAGKAL